ncbi:hypothetical protein HK102_009497 [Quaeritorhiza haematococci]|nr:hypothetical protein HK102_009497 [Quaeritorhiza haematococci]
MVELRLRNPTWSAFGYIYCSDGYDGEYEYEYEYSKADCLEYGYECMQVRGSGVCYDQDDGGYDLHSQYVPYNEFDEVEDESLGYHPHAPAYIRRPFGVRARARTTPQSIDVVTPRAYLHPVAIRPVPITKAFHVRAAARATPTEGFRRGYYYVAPVGRGRGVRYLRPMKTYYRVRYGGARGVQVRPVYGGYY